MFLCSTSLLARSVAAGPVLNLPLPAAAAIELLPTGNNNNADYIFLRTLLRFVNLFLRCMQELAYTTESAKS